MLAPRLSRWLKFAIGLTYSLRVIVTLVLFQTWLFYRLQGLIRIRHRDRLGGVIS
jgi:hypothetical protein